MVGTEAGGHCRPEDEYPHCDKCCIVFKNHNDYEYCPYCGELLDRIIVKIR